MKKKNFLAGLLAIANTLSGNAREFADEVVKAFEALEADTAEHDVTTLKDEIDEIAAKFAEQDQAVAEKIAKVRESIMSELRKNIASVEDKQVTRLLARAGKLLEIPVLDHLIVSFRGYTSLRREFPELFEV